MKKIMLLLVIALIAFGSFAEAQKIPSSPLIPIYSMQWAGKDSLAATDTAAYLFYAPYDMYVKSLQVVCNSVDTGSASPAGVVTITKHGATSATLTATVTAANSVAYSTVGSTKLTAGSYYKLGFTLSTNDKLRKPSVTIWYTR